MLASAFARPPLLPKQEGQLAQALAKTGLELRPAWNQMAWRVTRYPALPPFERRPFGW